MSAARPGSFEPVDSRDGVPGDPHAVAALARRYRDTAAEIEAQAANLQRLSASATAWKGQAGPKFAERAGDLAGRIGKARQRYAAAGRALQHFADRLEEVQPVAYSAVRDAQSADRDRRRLLAAAPVPTGGLVTPEQQLADAAAQRAHAAALDEATTRLSLATKAYETAKGQYRAAAQHAAELLRDGRSDDGLKDSWFDRNAGWIKTTLKVLGAVVFVLAVIALVIALFVPGLNVVVAGFAFSAVAALNATGAVLTAAVLGGQVAMWRTGHGSGADVAWSVAGLATFGAGLALAPVARALGGAASRLGQGLAAGRAGRAAFSARSLPGRLYDVGRGLPAARSVLSLSGRLRGAFTAADEAADAARTTVGAISGAPTTLPSRVLAYGDDSLAQLVTLTSRLDDAVPGTVRLAAVDAVARGSAAAWGLGVQGSLAVQGAAGSISDVFVEPGRQAAEDRGRFRTVDRWSNPLLHVR